MRAKLYGIRNCDTVKKARAWIAEHGFEVEFHDFKSDGVSDAQIARWLRHADWEILLNRRGLTWRNLADAKKTAVRDAAGATALMLEMPSIIKRPVLESGDQVLVGFDEKRYHALFERQS